MSASRKVRLCAAMSLSIILLSLATVAPSHAQYSPFAADAARSAELSTDPLTRSPGLAGMGRLSLVGEDRHNRITLWDFAGNPTGVALADSTTTIDLRPGAAGGSDVRDLTGGSAGRVQEMFSAHGGDLGYELWRRLGGLAYGAIGDLGSLQLDRPYNDDVEHRNNLTAPWAMPVINGVLPFTHSGRTRYALDIHWGQESVDSRYLLIVRNASGDFISLDSDEQKPPNVFVTEIYDVRQIGGGLALSQVIGSWLTAAVGYDGVALRLNGDNPDKRNDAQTHELRPYNIGQASLIGRIGNNFEWGVDGRGWQSNSETNWNFTISAGLGAIPLSGRGKLLERHEEGSSLRTRARWHAGALEIGMGLNTDYRRVNITPPRATDQTSFNYFLNTVFWRQSADSLALADSVIADEAQLRGWEAGGGLALHLPNRRGLIGIEYHRDRRVEQSLITGTGPRRVGWDVRSGLEYRLTTALAARTGYQYRWNDLDDFTRANEYRSHLVTAGLGLTPRGSNWTADLSYGIRWLRADYGDPGEPHGSRQQLVSQVHWAF